jgi:hypothetical protein
MDPGFRETKESLAECSGLFMDWVFWRPPIYKLFFFGISLFPLFPNSGRKTPRILVGMPVE